MNRRSLLTHAAVALTGGAAIAFAVPDMDARAVAAAVQQAEATIDDPLLALITEYRRQLAVYDASGSLTNEEDDALADVTYRPSWNKLSEAPPEPTTLEGALEALTLAHEEMEHGFGVGIERSLVGAALTFLKARA